LGVSVTDLVQPAGTAPMTELSDQQEQALVTNPQALVVTYLIVNDWKFDEIVSMMARSIRTVGRCQDGESGPFAESVCLAA
jgi:hypothetical protein